MAYKENMTLSERIYYVADAVASGSAGEGSIVDALEALEEAAGVTYDEVKYVEPVHPYYPQVLDGDEQPDEDTDEPTDPTDPSEPTDPTDPSESTDPTDPSEPTE